MNRMSPVYQLDPLAADDGLLIAHRLELGSLVETFRLDTEKCEQS